MNRLPILLLAAIPLVALVVGIFTSSGDVARTSARLNAPTTHFVIAQQ